MVQNRQKVKKNKKLAIFGTFFKVDFFENYTSNEAETKLNTLFKRSQKWYKIVKKLRLTPLLSREGFFKVNFLDVLFITLSQSAMTENLVSSLTGNYDSPDTTERNV